ncbi:MAG: hypothetical protein J6112_04130 [Clostridia bacterium]|nr:hypothetical protein [Clostridia bacterium]
MDNNNRHEKNNGGNRNRYQNRRPYHQNDKRGDKRENFENRDNRQQFRDNRKPQRPQQVLKAESTAAEIAAETKSIEAEIMMEIEELKSLKAKFMS